MSEEPPARKRYRSDESSDESLSRKPKFQASPSGLQCGSHLQQSIDESIRQLSVYQSDLRRGCVASMGRILAILDAMRAEIIGSAANDKCSLRLALPDEVLLDILVYLDRLRLEKLQYASRRFRTVVDLHMTDVCYRVIDCVHIQSGQFDHTVTAWIGNREDGGPFSGTPLLTSDISERGERRTIIASKLSSYKEHLANVLANVCRNANVLVYKITGETLSEAWLDLRETWPKLVPASANRMTVSELVLEGCTVDVPRDGNTARETIVMRMLEAFRRVHGVRLSIDVRSYGSDEDHREDHRNDVFTDRFLEFCAAHEIGSVHLSDWDKDITEEGVIDFLLNAPSDRSKRELSLSGLRPVTAKFYDALVKASTECATAHAAALEVDDCDPGSLPQWHIRDADKEAYWGWGGTRYSFLRGLLPFSITGESSCSGTFFFYKRGYAGYYKDCVSDDEEEHDGNDEEQEDNGNDEAEEYNRANDEEEYDGNDEEHVNGHNDKEHDGNDEAEEYDGNSMEVEYDGNVEEEEYDGEEYDGDSLEEECDVNVEEEYDGNDEEQEYGDNQEEDGGVAWDDDDGNHVELGDLELLDEC
ncbi:hypothetical protein AAVH_18975 [Aphelenchoides avenae]|nr:hypothetical protein AAVH_18975 [Aphelenchus avenae]